MIWHIAVHPDFSRQGIGQQLLYAAETKAKEMNINRFEAWTRDNLWVQNWYEKMKFKMVDSYYHVYFEGSEIKHTIQSNIPNLFLVNNRARFFNEKIAFFRYLSILWIKKPFM